MNTKTQKLAMLMQLASQSTSLHPVTAAHLLNSLQSLDESIQQLPDSGVAAENTHYQVMLALEVTGKLLYLLKNNLLDNLPGSLSHLLQQAEATHRNLLYAYSFFKEPLLPAPDTLIPVKQLIQQLLGLGNALQPNPATADLYRMLHAEIGELATGKTIQYHRWVWWSACCAQWLAGEGRGHEHIAPILAELNFNKGAFIRWLTLRLEKDLLERPVPQQISYLSDLAAWYYLLPDNPGYYRMQASVKQAMIKVIKLKLSVLRAVPGTLPLPVTKEKIQTCLSVPQLALFVRLLVDAKIISETNNAALLRSVALAVSTSRAVAVSAESLRINYYTPNTATKAIVKAQLLHMMRLLAEY